ncbi:unnamed protein product [Spirodela intermedia]|uniref:Uncharacterized protein n=1 Tax=Spirodela intermedia TaxID=51605 RepID=A0A7I8KE64_SPIIN|nr:unnamed protein product [Spirodela intermedia]
MLQSLPCFFSFPFSNKNWQKKNKTRQSPFSRMYDHSLPHSRLATGDMEGEWRTRACRSPSQAARAPARGLLPDCASDSLAGTRSMKWVVKSSLVAVTQRSRKMATL